MYHGVSYWGDEGAKRAAWARVFEIRDLTKEGSSSHSRKAKRVASQGRRGSLTKLVKSLCPDKPRVHLIRSRTGGFRTSMFRLDWEIWREHPTPETAGGMGAERGVAVIGGGIEFSIEDPFIRPETLLSLDSPLDHDRRPSLCGVTEPRLEALHASKM